MSLKSEFLKLAKSVRVALMRLSGRSEDAIRHYPALDQLIGKDKRVKKSAPEMLDIKQLMRDHAIKPRGVIHVGANVASELEEYIAMGFRKILYIEANPALIPGLKEKAARYPGIVYVAHAAVSDINGVVKLRVTSANQSSSILALGKHREIYPSIREVEQAEVPSRMLDTLLKEEGQSPSDYNFLNIDIQGAELLALRGSLGLITSIDAINTEVNLLELYEGCAMLKELENFLALQGFNRAAMATPWHPSWGDAFYVRKPVAAMSTLGRNGGFANQLFQYMFLRLVAKKQGAIVQTPHWVGQELFGFNEPQLILSLPEWRESFEAAAIAEGGRDNHEWARYFRNEMSDFRSTNFWGHFMGHSSLLLPDQDFIRTLFQFAPRFDEFGQDKMKLLRARKRYVLAVHLRRGDYGKGFFFRTPCSWYESWIRKSGLNPSDWIIYICSETPRKYRERFVGCETASAPDIGVNAGLATYLDFYVMTQADYVLTANSSYSFLACMLNRKAQGFARPCLEKKSLISFNPWNSNILDRTVLTVNEHESLKKSD